MSLNYRHICTAGMVSHHDLLAAHEALEGDPPSMSLRLVLLRHLIIEIGNVADLAVIASALYKDHPELSDLHRPIRKALELFKYLRNIYVGHFVPDLTDKTFDWLPQTNALLGSTEPNKQWIVSWFALETAINTYADPSTGHKIFDSDTDLNYPPDQARFLCFLGEAVLGAMAYIKQLIDVTRSYIDVPGQPEHMLKLAVDAGQMKFAVLTKGRR